MECLHENTKLETIENNVVGEVFKHETMVCTNCGAYLRDRDYEAAFMTWLENMYKSDRNKFQIQCHLSSNLIQCAEKYLADYPSVSLTFLFKTLVVVYLDYIDIDENMSKQFNLLMDKNIQKTFTEDTHKKRVNIQFKPKMTIELASMSTMIGMKPYQVIESCIINMMTSITTHNEKLRAFWESEIKKYVDAMLKVA